MFTSPFFSEPHGDDARVAYVPVLELAKLRADDRPKAARGGEFRAVCFRVVATPESERDDHRVAEHAFARRQTEAARAFAIVVHDDARALVDAALAARAIALLRASDERGRRRLVPSLALVVVAAHRRVKVITTRSAVKANSTLQRDPPCFIDAGDGGSGRASK